jgi:hypothetical protein
MYKNTPACKWSYRVEETKLPFGINRISMKGKCTMC